jgi:hypothetical protein
MSSHVTGAQRRLAHRRPVTLVAICACAVAVLAATSRAVDSPSSRVSGAGGPTTDFVVETSVPETRVPETTLQEVSTTLVDIDSTVPVTTSAPDSTLPPPEEPTTVPNPTVPTTADTTAPGTTAPDPATPDDFVRPTLDPTTTAIPETTRSVNLPTSVSPEAPNTLLAGTTTSTGAPVVTLGQSPSTLGPKSPSPSTSTAPPSNDVDAPADPASPTSLLPAPATTPRPQTRRGTPSVATLPDEAATGDATTTSSPLPSGGSVITLGFTELNLPELQPGVTELRGDRAGLTAPWQITNTSNQMVEVTTVFGPFVSRQTAREFGAITGTLRAPLGSKRPPVTGPGSLWLCPGQIAILDLRIELPSNIPSGSFTSSLKFTTISSPPNGPGYSCGQTGSIQQ